MRRITLISTAAGLALCGLFFSLGLLFVPLAGVHYDETLFTQAIYRPQHVEAVMKYALIGRVPVMLMTYLGTLKALLYKPVFALLGNGAYTLRVPVLAAGTVALWLFFLALRRRAGAGAAVLATALLATDAMFLMTSVYDWGPVALQHLLLTAAIYFAIRHVEQPQRARWLFLVTFCAGLALWDKALAAWLVMGFGAALLVCAPRGLWAIACNRRLAIATVAGLLVGAAPLIHYNWKYQAKTFTANAGRERGAIASKVVVLDRSLDGGGLFGYMIRDEPEPRSRDRESTGWERASVRLANVLGSPRHSWQPLLLILALFAAPVLCWPGPNRQLAFIFLIAGVLAYLQMITTHDGGGSLHHTILLWPLPQYLLGLAAGAAFERFGRRVAAGLVMATCACALSNLAVMNTNLANFIRYGPATSWNDAIRPLVNDLGHRTDRLVFAADWGVLQQVLFFGQGRIGCWDGSDGIVVGLPAAESQYHLRHALADTRHLFVTMTDGHDMFPNSRKKLLDFAAGEGYHDTLLAVIADRHQVPMFEIHEFRK
jgi:hypothetical protein